MENGVMIIDKIEALPIIAIILFFVVSLVLFIAAGVAAYQGASSVDVILIIAATAMLIFSIAMAGNNYDGYMIVTSEETKLEKFYEDWDIKRTVGKIYYAVPQSKDSIKMGEEYDNR